MSAQFQKNFDKYLKKIIWKKKHVEKPLLSLSLKNRTKSPYVHVVCKLQYAPVDMYPKNYTKTPYKHIISKIPYIRIISKLKQKNNIFSNILNSSDVYIDKMKLFERFLCKNSIPKSPPKIHFLRNLWLFLKNKSLRKSMQNKSD